MINFYFFIVIVVVVISINVQALSLARFNCSSLGFAEIRKPLKFESQFKLSNKVTS